MIRDIDGSANYTVNQECSLVYEYLHQDAAIQSPPETILKFQNLFKFAKNENVQVSEALEKIIFSHNQQFDIFLSQCVYTILDCWLEIPESISYVFQLFDAIKAIGSAKSYDRRRKQLAQLINNYFFSEAYLDLQTIIAIIQPYETTQISITDSLTTDSKIFSNNHSHSNSTLDTYLVRYTYLYKYCLPQEIQAQNLVSLVEKLQEKRQNEFEIMLSKHIIYRFRLKQLAKMRLMSKGAGKMIVKVENPSLLSEKAFRIALKQYIGKLDNNSTILERSQRFIAENEYRPHYKKFKQDLYCFLISSIKPRNSAYQFDNQLKSKLSNSFAHSDAKPLNRTLILQTCRQLFSFLTVDPASNNDSSRFAELIANLGTAQIMMILIKIVLICPEAKADLAKKMHLIAVHHQLKTVQEASWLLKSLEHLLIAFSIYFGNIDVTIIKSVVSK